MPSGLPSFPVAWRGFAADIAERRHGKGKRPGDEPSELVPAVQGVADLGVRQMYVFFRLHGT